MQPHDSETNIRKRLGIPEDAGHVLIFAESSHWDPDWLHTSKWYYQRFVRGNLDKTLAELLKEPRRVYSLECIFFLRQYWENQPAQRDAVCTLVNARRLRLTSSGVTTADTLLSRTESILRDFLLGQEWLRNNGMTQEPQIAYFPDSFGYAHNLPSLLNAAGFHATGITRLDGMLFPGCELDWWNFPRAGSSAELLLNKEKTLDFVWRDQSGGEVLCHWNAFTYGQGDMLAYRGINRAYFFPVYFADRSDWNVSARIHSYVKQLQPYSRTPYLFCPIGFDFNSPIPGLVSLLDRYNQRHFSRTGVWAVNAGLDDYLALVACHRENLPTLELDPNPYWSGFYSARPALKKLCYDLVDHLLLAETLALQPDKTSLPEAIVHEFAPAWWNSAVSNHHDFITGTSTDAVVANEQRPWLKSGIRMAEYVLARWKDPGPKQPAELRSALPEWRLNAGILTIDSPQLHLVLSEETGGCIVQAADASGRPVLTGPSNDIIDYRDSGGLWRMGHEFPGGVLRETARASQKPEHLSVREMEDVLEVSCEGVMNGIRVTRRMWLGSQCAGIHFQIEGRAREKHTLAVRFETGIQAERLYMDDPGGWVNRPTYKHYKPTYWPFQNLIQLTASDEPRSAVFLRGMPGAGVYCGEGRFELVAQRNATQETAFGFLHFLGMPVKGHENEVLSLDYGVLFLDQGSQSEDTIHAQGQAVLQMGPGGGSMHARWQALVKQRLEISPASIEVLALKPAARRAGMLLRLFAPGTPDLRTGRLVRIKPLAWPVKRAFLCDAREREIRHLPVHDGEVELELPGSIASILFY